MVFPFPCLYLEWKQQGNTYFGSNKGTPTDNPSDKEFVLVSTSHLTIITHHKTCFVQQVGDQITRKVVLLI